MTKPLHLPNSSREERRAIVLQDLRRALAKRALSWEVNRGGVHLVIRVPKGPRIFDFWPGTGNWRERDNTMAAGALAMHRGSLRRGAGVLELLVAIDGVRS